MSPVQRFQYINWLKDITKETNLSYVFLYFYGLERHLLVGNYDLAVDETTTEIAALLHDIGRRDIKNDELHHITGVSEAEDILANLGYSEEIIKEVKHYVASHRTSKGPKPQTMIAKIVANADAMSHFDILPVFYYWRGKRNYSVKEITEWTENKLEKDWEKKITLPEAKELVRDKYEAIKTLLNAIKKYDN